jgi:hypothetical protein
MKKVISPKQSLIKEDWIAAGKRALIFLAPFILVLIPQIISTLPPEATYYTIALFLLNRLTDLLRRYVSETTYKK